MSFSLQSCLFVFRVQLQQLFSESLALSGFGLCSCSAYTFPLSLFGAGVPLQVISGRGATGSERKDLMQRSFFEIKFWIRF